MQVEIVVPIASMVFVASLLIGMTRVISDGMTRRVAAPNPLAA